MKVTYAGAAILALLATACGETRSVKYFRDHPDEAREVKIRCGANGMAGKDCGNAVTALNELQREEFERARETNRRNRASPQGLCARQRFGRHNANIG